MKRLFLTLAVVTAALLTVSCKKDKPNDNLGLQLYSIRAECAKDINTALDGTAAAGYKIAEAASYNQQEAPSTVLRPRLSQTCAHPRASTSSLLTPTVPTLT